jgi:hypothetical protein
MAEIIDILTPNINETAKFTVDTSGPDYVSIVAPIPSAVDLHDANIHTSFVRGDNFIVLSIGFMLPEMFTLWKPSTNFNPLLKVNVYPEGILTAHPYYSPNFPEGINLSLECYEMGLGVFFDVGSAIDSIDPTHSLYEEEFSLKIKWLWTSAPRVSMLNVPTVYHGKQFQIIPFLKILHNFPMEF